MSGLAGLIMQLEIRIMLALPSSALVAYLGLQGWQASQCIQGTLTAISSLFSKHKATEILDDALDHGQLTSIIITYRHTWPQALGPVREAHAVVSLESKCLHSQHSESNQYRRTSKYSNICIRFLG
jgi:hypothetical protein